MSASYDIIPILQDPAVNPGDKVKIDVYLSGSGNIGRRRIHVLHPYEGLFQEEIGEISLGIAQVPQTDIDQIENPNIHSDEMAEEENLVFAMSQDQAPDRYKIAHDLNSASTVISLPDWMFQPIPESLMQRSNPDLKQESEPSFPLKLVEGMWQETAPCQIELNISEEADPGDYEIYFIFTYETETGIRTSRRKASVHVNDWIEKRQPNLKRIVIAVAILSLLFTALEPLFSAIL